MALIPFAGLAVVPWRNGAGRKADIAAGPDWLVGFAWLDGDAPFSDYAGHDRTIVLVEGVGFTLDFGPSHPPLVARSRYVPGAFEGGWPPRCRVPDGPCLVLNAMTARATRTHTVTVSPVPARVAPSAGGVLFLVVLDGRVSVGNETAAPHDTIAISEATPLRAEPDARAALIQIMLPSAPEHRAVPTRPQRG